MRPCAVVPLALAGMLFAAQARAQITPWSNPRPADSRAHTSHVTVFGAFAAPEGELAHMSPSGAAFARPGASLGLDYAAHFTHDIEAGGMLLFDGSPTHGGAFAAAFAAVWARDGFGPGPVVVPATSLRITWGLLKAGYAPQVGGRLQAEVHVYGGGFYSNWPEVEVLDVPSGLPRFQFSQSLLGLAMGAGAGVRWRDHLTVSLLYLSGSPAQFWSEDLAYRERVSMLHLTLGYTFGH